LLKKGNAAAKTKTRIAAAAQRAKTIWQSFPSDNFTAILKQDAVRPHDPRARSCSMPGSDR
jgi:hypothetical protein